MLAASFLGRVFRHGVLCINDAHGRSHVFGGKAPGPEVTIALHDPVLHRRLLTDPYLAAGEAYMDGTLTVEQGTLREFLDLVGRNMNAFEDHPFGKLAYWGGRIARVLQQHNPVGRARQNVAHHYDLSDALYDMFLDGDRQYSCAYWHEETSSLEDAQENKKRHIAAKLRLEPGHKVLDIGCGWGGMGLYLAGLGAREVVGVTLSERQERIANRRALQSDLAGRVHFRLQDYREVQDRFDRIVSVGMFEHVGARHYEEFFRHIKRLLDDDGVFLLHSIGRMEPPGATNPWLRKYIFPGGYTPALSEVTRALENVGGLWVTDLEILRLHYARTLREWYRRFVSNRERVRELYDERFCRMWEFYLLGCEMAFHYWNQMVFQMQITRDQKAVPLTRDYMVDWERGRPHAGPVTLASVADAEAAEDTGGSTG